MRPLKVLNAIRYSFRMIRGRPIDRLSPYHFRLHIHFRNLSTLAMDDFLLVRSGPYPGAQGAASVAALKQGNTKAFARRTKTFPTETEAKQFAKEMLSNKYKVVAGTLR